MNEEQTFRSEDNRFFLGARTIVTTFRKYVVPMKQDAKTQKDFEAARLGVFATSDLFLTQLNWRLGLNLTRIVYS